MRLVPGEDIVFVYNITFRGKCMSTFQILSVVNPQPLPVRAGILGPG